MNSSDFFFLFVSIVAAAEFDCPKPDGQFQDERQCDKYYVCDDGVAKAKLCPDGLVFDPLNRKINKCDQPFNVDCEDRTELRKDLCELFLSLSLGVLTYISSIFRGTQVDQILSTQERFLCPSRGQHLQHLLQLYRW